MYYVDTTKFEQMLKRYNITASRAVRLVDGKVVYYTGFKTLKLPVINTAKHDVKMYQLSTIVNGLRDGKSLFPFCFTKCLSYDQEIDLNMILKAFLKRGISYADYFVFMHGDRELCFSYKGSLYIYPVKLNSMKSLHLGKDFLQINSSVYYSNISLELKLNLKDEVFISENFFGLVRTENDAKKLGEYIDIKRSLVC